MLGQDAFDAHTWSFKIALKNGIYDSTTSLIDAKQNHLKFSVNDCSNIDVDNKNTILLNDIICHIFGWFLIVNEQLISIFIDMLWYTIVHTLIAKPWFWVIFMGSFIFRAAAITQPNETTIKQWCITNWIVQCVFHHTQHLMDLIIKHFCSKHST